MSNAESGGNKRWVAIFGNGYNSTSANGNAILYVVFLEGGQDGVWTANSDFIKIDTGFGKAQSSDGTTPNGIGGVRGIDIDGNGTVDHVYAGDLQGNLFRFNQHLPTGITRLQLYFRRDMRLAIAFRVILCSQLPNGLLSFITRLKVDTLL